MPLCERAHTHNHTLFFFSLSLVSSHQWSPPLRLPLPPLSLGETTPPPYRAARLVCILTVRLPRSCSLMPCDRSSMCTLTCSLFFSLSCCPLVLTHAHTHFQWERKYILVKPLTAAKSISVFWIKFTEMLFKLFACPSLPVFHASNSLLPAMVLLDSTWKLPLSVSECGLFFSFCPACLYCCTCRSDYTLLSQMKWQMQ